MVETKYGAIKIAVILATTQNGALGINDRIPWVCPEDMAYFRNKTMNRVCIVGNKTYQSVKHLKNRHFVVLTNNPEKIAPPSIGVKTLETAYEQAALLAARLELVNIIFVIGGGQVYKQVLDDNRVDVLYITYIKGEYQADTVFSLEPYLGTKQLYKSIWLSDSAVVDIWCNSQKEEGDQ